MKTLTSFTLAMGLTGCAMLFPQPNAGDMKQTSQPPVFSIRQHHWVDNWQGATGTYFYDPYSVVNNGNGTFDVWVKKTNISTATQSPFPGAQAGMMSETIMCGAHAARVHGMYFYNIDGTFVGGATMNKVAALANNDAVYEVLCSNSPVTAKVPVNSRLAFVRDHPGEPRQIRQDILDGAIVQGMTKADVIASWGNPCWYCVGTTHNSWGDSWEYNIFGSAAPGGGTYVFFNADGIVTGWSGN